LSANFENARRLRSHGLILGNPDGLDDLTRKHVLRAVQPIQALNTQSTRPGPGLVTDFTVVDPAVNPA